MDDTTLLKDRNEHKIKFQVSTEISSAIMKWKDSFEKEYIPFSWKVLLYTYNAYVILSSAAATSNTKILMV